MGQPVVIFYGNAIEESEGKCKDILHCLFSDVSQLTGTSCHISDRTQVLASTPDNGFIATSPGVIADYQGLLRGGDAIPEPDMVGLIHKYFCVFHLLI